MSASNQSQSLSLSISGTLLKKLATETSQKVLDTSSSERISKRNTVPVSELKRQFEYDEKYGCLRWKIAPPRKPNLKGCRPGHPNKDGYQHMSVRCDGQRIYVLEHRAIWAMTYDYWPEELDHINGDPQDNRLENLREVDHRENCLNGRVRSRNTSGVSGVTWEADREKWLVRINTGIKNINCGRFDSFEDAVAARKEAEARYGYHPNHGRA